MTKKIEGREGPIIGIYSSLDLFEKLKHESDRLKKEWHPYDAFNFLVTAWHLFNDWPKSDPKDSPCRIKRQRARLPSEMNFILDIIRDLVNGSKHFQLDLNSASKRRVSEVHTGDEAGWYEFLFHEEIPAVTVDDYWYFSIRVLHNTIIKYYEWVFDDSKINTVFPDEIIATILHCNIAKRGGEVSPPLWLANLKKPSDLL